MKLSTLFLAGAGLLLFAAAPAVQAQLIYTSGHVDIGVAYDDHDSEGGMTAQWNVDHGANIPEGSYAPGDVVGLFTTLTSAPAGAVPGLGGVTGPVYFADLGFGGHLHTHNAFDDDEITVRLVNVSGPGALAVYSSFDDYLYFSSFDAALTGEDNLLRLSLDNMGGDNWLIHAHHDWYFSQEGRYDVTLLWEGMQNGQLLSTQETFTFYAGAIPEPGTYALMISSAVAVLGFRRWRRGSAA